MKVTIFTIPLIIFLLGCLGQYPKLKVSDGKVYNSNAPRYRIIAADTSIKPFIYYENDTMHIVRHLYILPDTVKVIMQVSDTSRQKWDTKIYWIRGYRVNADNETFYLDINKKRLPPSVIIWLDQNL